MHLYNAVYRAFLLTPLAETQISGGKTKWDTNMNAVLLFTNTNMAAWPQMETIYNVPILTQNVP